MGCCISKCKPKKISKQDLSNHVQDKLVIISQPSKKITPVIPTSNKISPCPPSPTASSDSSVTCTNHSDSTTTTSSSSVSSSSIFTSKDRSFSNEFLWSCVKENPHIIRINSIKEHSQFLVHPSPNVHAPTLDWVKQKRVRSNSPTPLNRQKSFRRETERVSSLSHSVPSRALRSPSPSRRFNGDSGRGISTCTSKESCSKRIVVRSKVNAANYGSPSPRKENYLTTISPHMNNSSHHYDHIHNYNHNHNHNLRSCLRNRETCIHRISSKIDEVAVQEALAQQDSHDSSIPMEDIHNPLISLDCFIFL